MHPCRPFALCIFAAFLCPPTLALANPSLHLNAAADERLSINLHLNFAPPLFPLVVAANAKLANLPNQTIRFPHPHSPHLTLFLSTFLKSSLPDLLAAVEDVAKSPLFLTPCASKVSSAAAIGSYSMLPVAVNDCLQNMSDLLVRRTHHLALSNQTIPAWILLLPEPERSMKMDMLSRFGSPNVLSQFNPHITLACAPNASGLFVATRDLKWENISSSFIPLQLRVSVSGACGTVLSDQTLLSINLSTQSNSSGNVSNNACAAFKVVSLTTGSSNNCIGGNTHVWPLLPEGQCHGWSAVDTSGTTHKNSANGMRCNTNGSFSFVQFAGNLDCSGIGHEKTFSAGKCEQVIAVVAIMAVVVMVAAAAAATAEAVAVLVMSVMTNFGFLIIIASRTFLPLCGQLL